MSVKPLTYEPVTIGVVNYNGEHLLIECLTALKNLNYPDYSILVIDNKSVDKSIDLVRNSFSDIKIIELDRNTGVNFARNVAIRMARTNFVFLVENDAVVQSNCLKVLMDTMISTNDAAVCCPRIVFHHAPDIIQYDGTEVHYIGAGIHERRYTRVNGKFQKPIALPAGNGIILLNRQKAIDIGLFDEDYFLSWDDGEFTVRVTISGAKCMHVPQALTYHKTKKRGLKRVFEHTRNRWYFILTIYSFRTIILIFPTLIVHEISLFLFLLFKGSLSKYFKGNFAVIKEFKKIMKKRKWIQSLRKIPDRCILRSGKITIAGELINNKHLKVARDLLDSFFDSYWNFIKKFI